MNPDELSQYLKDNIERILDKDVYKRILNCGNNLIRFDSMNKIILALQIDRDANVYDLRTPEEWDIAGRGVIDHSKCFTTAVPIYEVKYYDTSNNEEVSISDLNLDEKSKAIEIGIIRKESSVKNVRAVKVYDILNTKAICETPDTILKPILGVENLLQCFKDITDAQIYLTDAKEDYYYSAPENILYIPKSDYNTAVERVVEPLIVFYRRSKNCEIDIDEIEGELKYSITTLFHGDISKLDLKVPDNVSDAIQIINNVDIIVSEIVKRMKFSGNPELLTQPSDNIDVLRKAEVVLNIVEAAAIQNKIRAV